MESKIDIKRELLQHRENEIEDLKEEIRNDLKEIRFNKANELLHKYKKEMLEIIELAKKQEEIYEKIYNENYQQHKNLCYICSDLEWDYVFDRVCPLAYICGYMKDGYGLLEFNDQDENVIENIINKKQFKKEDMQVWEDEV